MAETDSHLYINYKGPMIPTPQSLILSVDGHKVIDLPVLDANPAMPPRTLNTILADMPEDTYSKVIVPAMVSGNMLQVDVRDRRFTAQISYFTKVRDQITSCTEESNRRH